MNTHASYRTDSSLLSRSELNVGLIEYASEAGLACNSHRAPVVCQDGAAHQVLVMDVSSSMNGRCERELSKLEVLKRSAIPVINIQHRQNRNGRITLVAFDHQSTVIADECVDEHGHCALVQAIKGMKTGGSTDIYSALRMGGAAFDPNHFGLKQLTLLSDGAHTEPSNPRDVADEIRNRGISIATIGFGEDADEAMLRAIASQRDGVPVYWHARDQKTLTQSLRNATTQA